MNKPSLALQKMQLEHRFPGSRTNLVRDERLTWIHSLTPSPLSCTYKVKLLYVRGNGVKFWILEPKLELAKGATSLPHVYSREEQRICLYLPRIDWNDSMLFVESVIPWACEWLLQYELWVATGVWYGGGEHPIPVIDKLLTEEKEEDEQTKRK